MKENDRKESNEFGMHDDLPQPPPHIRFKRIDWSEFHPIDHWLWSCRGYSGGWRRHLMLWWEFWGQPWARGHTVCRVGRWSRHRKSVGTKYQDGKPVFQEITCRDCRVPLSPKVHL